MMLADLLLPRVAAAQVPGDPIPSAQPTDPAPPPQPDPPAPPAPAPPPADAPPAPAPEPPPPPPAKADAPKEEAKPEKPLAGYESGFFIQSPDGKYRLVIGGYVQFRFTYEGFEEADDKFSFSIPRARIQLAGNLFSPDFTYKVVVDFGKGAVPSLKDGFLDYAAVRNWLHFRAGSFKMPFTRHQLASSSKLDMVDRAITDKAFGAGRDLGIMIHNDVKSPFEYAVGLFNGYGEVGQITADVTGVADLATGDVTGELDSVSVTNVPARFKPRLVARVGYNHAGIVGYDELDFEGGAPRFAIAANTKIQFNADLTNQGYIDWGGDVMFKAFGLTLQGGLFPRWAQDGGSFSDLSYNGLGFHVGGNFLYDKTAYFQARYARVVPRGTDDDVQEILGGVGVFAFDKHLKSVLDAGPILSDTPDGERLDWRIRTQLQVLL